MLALRDVDSFYGRSHALHGVSMDVANGAITAVLGRNGVGKTTLLKTIIGLIDRIRGRIELQGADIAPQPAFRRARLGIAYVPQGREIIPDFSVRENILMGAFARADGCRAASSSNSPPRARPPPTRSCCCWTSRPRASSPASSRRSRR